MRKSIDYELMESLLTDGEPVAGIARQCKCSVSHVMSIRPLLARKGLIIPGYAPHDKYNKRGKYEEESVLPCSDPRFRPGISMQMKTAGWSPEHKAAWGMRL